MSAKTALITGAAGGIGKSLCEVFKSENYQVIATDVVRSDDTQCDLFIEQDLASLALSEDVSNNFKQRVQAFMKESQLNVLINNAAIQILGKTDTIRRSDWFTTLNVNLTAPLFLSQIFVKELEATRGCIINISSVHVDATKPNFVSYATSKAALSGLTKTLAVDLGGRVRVNAISPAATATDMLLAGFENNPDGYKQLEHMHPIGRIAEPDEIAKVAVFLASDAASFMTGSCINVDGGISARLHDPD
ncbi:MAG: SDR family oxidoreductase [Candidatus Thiodiazotropha sp.]